MPEASDQRCTLVALDAAQRVDPWNTANHQQLALFVDLLPNRCDAIRRLCRLPQQLEPGRVVDPILALDASPQSRAVCAEMRGRRRRLMVW